MLITGSYILYLVIQICLTLVENFSISHYANKKYPYLREKDVAKLSPGEIREIKKNVSAVLMHKIGGAIVNSTDNILLSKLFGLVVVGLYSNYYTIISALRTIIQQLFTSVVASIGNLHVDKSNEHEEVVFNRIFYANFWICSFSTICMLVLFKSFIMLWIGEEYILDDIVVYAISLSFYLENMRKTLISFKEATGAFYADRFRPIFESLINLCASIVLAKYLGISGIFWGTALASITTSWFETYIVYRDIFKKSMIRYYTRYLYYFLVTVAGYLICSAACSKIPYGFLGFVIKLFICVVLSNLIILVTTLRFDESKYYIFLVKKYTRKFRHK